MDVCVLKKKTTNVLRIFNLLFSHFNLRMQINKTCKSYQRRKYLYKRKKRNLPKGGGTEYDLKKNRSALVGYKIVAMTF